MRASPQAALAAKVQATVLSAAACCFAVLELHCPLNRAHEVQTARRWGALDTDLRLVALLEAMLAMGGAQLLHVHVHL
jgi:hypothetical protein